MAGPVADVQIDSELSKDLGGIGVGYVSFSKQPAANDIITVGARGIEFDGVGANINVAIGGTLALTLAAAVAAINADGTILADAIVGANDACLNFVARSPGTAGNLGIVDTVDSGAAMICSAALMVGGKATAITESYRESYTITAIDVQEMAAGAQDAEICIAAIPKTTAPTSTQITVWDTTGLIHPFASLLFVWRQINANYYGLFLEDNGPLLAAGDTIEIIAAY